MRPRRINSLWKRRFSGEIGSVPPFSSSRVNGARSRTICFCAQPPPRTQWRLRFFNSPQPQAASRGPQRFGLFFLAHGLPRGGSTAPKSAGFVHSNGSQSHRIQTRKVQPLVKSRIEIDAAPARQFRSPDRQSSQRPSTCFVLIHSASISRPPLQVDRCPVTR
jgi:hypothetical protein